jgi:surface protein
LAVLSVAILSSVLAVSPAFAQFLSDGVTPVTPIPSNAVFRIAIAACVSEAPVTGVCPIYGDGSGYGDMENWDTSNVTDMSSAFAGASISFNADISVWNTGNVTDMSSLIIHKSSFNQNIGNWNTANVTNMNSMFYNATAFNQNIGSWTTSGVTDMR